MRLKSSTSPREETRLLSRLCVELAKGQEQVLVGLYTVRESPPERGSLHKGENGTVTHKIVPIFCTF